MFYRFTTLAWIDKWLADGDRLAADLQESLARYCPAGHSGELVKA